MSYYKRATVFMALSRSRPALTDLDKVIQLKPDFVQARVKRGVILTKMGRLDEAHIELERVLAKDPGNDEANKLYVQIEPLEVSIREIRDFIASKNFQPALDRLSEVIEVKIDEVTLFSWVDLRRYANFPAKKTAPGPLLLVVVFL